MRRVKLHCIEPALRATSKQVHYLVEQGHPLNPRDHCGWTPLHEACNHGHLGIVSLLLDKGANINDPGGAYCDGVTPLHDALSCGHFEVARLLVQKGASVNVRNNKGDKPLDTLRQWLKTYGRELDQDTRQDCSETEKLLKRALSGAVAAVPVTPQPLQDSQLFDAECSEPLLQQKRGDPLALATNPEGLRRMFCLGLSAAPLSTQDSDISPLRPVRPRPRFQDVSSSSREGCASQDIPAPHGVRGTELPSQPSSGREEYHRAIQNLGSAKSRLLSQSLSEPAFSSTPVVSTNHASALVPEEHYIQDDWLEDDLGSAQPKKKRRVFSEQGSRWESVASRNQNRASGSFESSARGQSSSSRSLSLKKNNKARQVKMSQLPGMVMLGRREVTRSPSPIITPVDEPPQLAHPQPYCTQAVPQAVPQSSAAPVPAPIRMRVRVQNNVFLIPVPHSEADSCTVSWLCEQAAQRYYQTCGLLPRLSLQKEGALLSPADLLLAVLHTNEEVLAEVCSWDLPPLPERYKKACKSLDVEENGRVLRLCEVQDGSPHVCVCGLSLAPSSLSPLLRALKLQSSLTELSLSSNRLNDDLLPELISAATTMPRLRLLDISANQITGEGIKKAASALEGRTQHAFPCLEELNVSMNPLGDGWSQALACLLSACPLLATLSLQACGLTARFLQQHRLLLASALSGTGHLRSVCLSQNALGSTGFELVLKTLPLQHLTHLELNAVCKGPSDQPALDLFTKLLTQGDCSLTHLGLAANGLTDQSVRSFTRCLIVCPSLVSLDLSANPSVTSAGLHSLLNALDEARRPLTHLNLQGCQVCGPWDAVCLDSLAERVQDLRLCSQRLNKMDQEILRRNWPGRILSRNSKCLLSIAPVPH
ncbi:hypothetical protein PHYPO_G00015870 [Pangasianodon hypophthalmus]|uniref:Uncharacterized protein n=1 Tax=Pangasianodon hypophthalmus TaxID=310915 RepID=A0A5N5N405_PANHP|nr:hypothetical protein PHYPO_G00015870 [Pangasianodon hypophthalmus]